VAAVWAILRKECRSEWRTRYGIHAALLFAVATLSGVSFAVGRLPDRSDLLAALLWVVLLFAALASLAHAFVREVEGHTLTFLRLVAAPVAIGIGKLLFNLLFLAVLELVTVPLFLILMGAPGPRWGPFLLVRCSRPSRCRSCSWCWRPASAACAPSGTAPRSRTRRASCSRTRSP